MAKKPKSESVPATPEEAAEQLQDERGDLTPEYAKWLKEHALPHEFDAVYAGREEELKAALNG